jgi:hypothetical protein
MWIVERPSKTRKVWIRCTHFTEIQKLVYPIANWSPGVYWPPAIAGGITDVAVQNVVAELQREFDISD